MRAGTVTCCASLCSTTTTAYRPACFLQINRWPDGVDLVQTYLTAPHHAPDRWTPVTRAAIGCVWGLPVIAHERDAWDRHVLAPADGPHLHAYLDDVLRPAGRHDTARQRLVAALAVTDRADDKACLNALASGATVISLGDPSPTDTVVRTYRRRITRLRARGTLLVGNDAVERLKASGHPTVRIALIHGTDNYAVFLEPDRDVVIASLGVDAAVANPDYPWP